MLPTPDYVRDAIAALGISLASHVLFAQVLQLSLP